MHENLADTPIHTGIEVPLETLINLRYKTQGWSLRSNKRVANQFSGEYHSSFRGRGIEFDETRIYTPGDDTRTIDWRVTARTGKMHTKVFKEEKERPVFIIIDQSNSMLFGTRVTLKSSIAAIAGALTAWTAMLQGDRVGAFVFSGKTYYEYRPRARKYGVLPLLQTLSQTTIPTPRDDNRLALEEIFQKLRHVIRPGSLVFIYSDFSSLTDKAMLQLAPLSRHCEIKAGFITDKLEETPPRPNIYSFSNGEQIFELDIRQTKNLQKYHDYFAEKQLKLKTLFNQYQIPLLKLTTGCDVVKTLQKGFIHWETCHE